MSDTKRADAKKEKKGRFLNAFLFTENGRPKSSLWTYTFCLSFVFLAVYLLSYGLVIELLTRPLAGAPAFVSNLIEALLASALGVLAACFLHERLRDKRLVFGAHIWLVLYAAAVLVAMLILLGGTEGVSAFLVFYGWFVFVPVSMGFFATGWLYRRDHHPEAPREEEPEWKKYVNRR